MKKIYFIALTIVATLLLNGCAAIGMRRDIPQTERMSIRTIGVVSVLGNEFHSTYIGTTIFGNKSHSMNVNAWNIDEHAISVAIKVLDSMGPYQAQSLGSGFTDISAVMDTARKAGVDAVVAIIPSGYDNQPHYVGGYGFHRHNMFGIQRDCIYSLFTTNVYAVSSARELGWEWSFPTSKGIGCYGKTSDGKSWTTQMQWREHSDEYSERERKQFRTNILESVSDSVSYSLRNLGL